MTNLKGMVIQSHLDKHLNVDLGPKVFYTLNLKHKFLWEYLEARIDLQISVDQLEEDRHPTHST